MPHIFFQDLNICTESSSRLPARASPRQIIRLSCDDSQTSSLMTVLALHSQRETKIVSSKSAMAFRTNPAYMYTKPLLFLTGLLLHGAIFAQQPTPSIEAIANKFYNTYDTKASDHIYGFEKHGRQWRVSFMKWEGGLFLPAGSYLFYDADSGGYRPLPLSAKSDTGWVDYRQHVDDYALAGYHIHVYYGYAGWYKDVIAALSGQPTLSDTSLNSLARAYSAYASCLLTDQSGDALKSDLFNLPLARNCLTPDQREKYHAIESKAIEAFAQLSRQNPDFETIVGKSPIKYANEVMVEFHTYLTYADSFAMTFRLPDALYPDTVIAKSRRVLEKCPPDAILLSLGDNDFYPILYVQHHLNVRTDVRLINENLIGLDRYIFMAEQPQFQSNPVHLSVTPRQYQGGINDYLYLMDRPTAMPFPEVIDTLLRGHRNKDGALTLPGKEFVLQRLSKTAKSDTLHFRQAKRTMIFLSIDDIDPTIKISII